MSEKHIFEKIGTGWVNFIQSAQNLSDVNKYRENKKPGWINKGESNTPNPDKRKFLRNKRKSK